ncbi:class GN sortase [Marinobacter sp. SS21]|uniref:class GN sortase n=1 Tax=Marinobacter sp. SS21 TaxID=2979460 RepID=UPI00232C1925|nr:class GN sortase [Marinobacter sp. SS21]MDC0662948.1 class GN sortase [Marinobacter sp. SS21]
MNRLIGLALMASLLTLATGLWIPAKALLAQELLELAWAESQARQSAARPWPWADTWPVARLALPETGHSWIVMDGVHGESLAFGPGRMAGTDPASGPVMIAGHRDTHFRALERIDTGTRVDLQGRDGQWQQYRVSGIRVVDSRREGIDLARLPADRLLLVTCYPFDSLNSNGPLRYVVEAERVAAQWAPSPPKGAHKPTDT